MRTRKDCLRRKGQRELGHLSRVSECSSETMDVAFDYGSTTVTQPRHFSTGFFSGVSAGDGYTAVSDDEVIEAALRVVAARVIRSTVLSSIPAVREYLALRFASLEHEVFSCLYLNNKHRIIAYEDLFRGTIDGTNVYPREVVKRALAHNAAAVILAHNHTSGAAEPSHSDELITFRLVEALSVVGIRVLDHLIIGGDALYSFREMGLLAVEDGFSDF